MTSVKEIQQAVCNVYNMTLDDMLRRRNHRSLSEPRQLAMYLAVRVTKLSLPQIAKVFERDHTTVIHARDQVARRLRYDKDLHLTATTLLAHLGGATVAATAAHFSGYRPTPKMQPEHLYGPPRLNVQRAKPQKPREVKQRMTKGGWDQTRSRPKVATKPRDCMTCGSTFQSQGAHNRMCDPCRKTVHDDDYGVAA